ncbi:MAG: hypothetical protein NTV46_02895 [Verrucomicrobia bacterium]|nr:hypothetical protein [Verrucomicrobiota bacterium]
MLRRAPNSSRSSDWRVSGRLRYLKQKDPKRWGLACDKLLPYYTDTLLRLPAAAKPTD